MLELYRPSLRAVAAMVILAAWIASLGWLAARRINRTEESTLSSEATLRLAPGTAWYAVYAGSTQIGNAAVTLDTLSPGYRISEDETVESRAGSDLIRTARRTEAWLSATLNLQHLRTVKSRATRQSIWNILVAGDTVSARFESGKTVAQGRTRFGEVPTPSVAVPYRLALGGGGLASGRIRTIRMLDGWPLGGALARITVSRDSTITFADSARVEGADRHWVVAHTDSVRAFAVTINGVRGPRRLWIDHRGAISGVETPFGVRWVRTDFDLSETEFRRTEPTRAAMIAGAIPELAPYAASNARLDTITTGRRFLVQHRDGSPVNIALLILLSGGRQTVQGDTVTVAAQPAGLAGESIQDTISDPMIQQDAGPITKLRRKLITEPLDRERLPAFLATFRSMLRVDTSATGAEDALGTLNARGGTADGITRLFVALLRSSGVPARFVVGVYPAEDTLLTHAWAEIWSGATHGWYAVDPVSGAASANTGLIRLGYGGSSRPDEMLGLLANARLTEIGPKEKP